MPDPTPTPPVAYVEPEGAILKGCWEALNIAVQTCAYQAKKAKTKRDSSSLSFAASECRFALERVERRQAAIRAAIEEERNRV